MTQRIKLLVWLICISLISVLAVQGYFLYIDFHTKKVNFRNDLNSILEITAKEMNRLREREIYRLHLRDLRDPAHARLVYDFEDKDGPALKVYKAGTDNLQLVISTTWDKVDRDSLSEDYLFKKLFKPLKDKGYDFMMSLSMSLDDKIFGYRDSLSIDMELFRSKLNDRMANRAITPDYEMLFLHKDSTYTFSNNHVLASDRFEFEHQGEDNEVIIFFDRPFFNIIKRSYALLFGSLCAVALIAYSFVLLMKTIGKQRKLSQLKDDFIDNVTHELLTPIATMKISLETLRKPDVQVDAEKMAKYVGVSERELDRVSGIVHNVLQTSLHEQDELRLHYEEVNLNELITGLISYHSERSEKVVEFRYQPGEPVLVNTDKQHISNVLHNLIDNAIKYNQQEYPVVDIKIAQRENEVSVIIADNGPGIAKGHEEKVFGKFHRVVNENSDSIGGLGVGLYYVRNILSRLNGQIRLISNSTAGSVFEVILKS